MYRSRLAACALLLALALPAFAAEPLTWEAVRERFRAQNPALAADKLNIDESKAQEITAFLRPNPDLTLSTDGTQISPNHGVWQPLVGTQFVASVSYLHERQRQRELRRESAQGATRIAESSHADFERTLLFGLRSAFVATLQAKTVRQLAKDNLAYYDKVLEVSRERFHAGDIAQVDLDRLELQRVQYEADLQNAEVNLRTAKIQILTLLNDRTPVEQFDVAGTFDFADALAPLEEWRQQALASRPDLKAALQAVEKSESDHKLALANGAADPTFSAWYSHNPSFNNPNALNTLGASVSFPLRLFDRNQGEKLRTQLDVARAQHLRQAAESQVFSDVDSGYAQLESTLALVRPYKARYLPQSVRVRDTIYYAYQHGGASLLDFLSAESDYRQVQLNYVNLVGSYLTAAAQLNLAVGREVIP